MVRGWLRGCLRTALPRLRGLIPPSGYPFEGGREAQSSANNQTGNIMTKQQAENRARLFERLANLGFSYSESEALIRIERTLQRWGELECGDGNDWASWSVERDEETGKPFIVTHPHSGKSYRRAIPDREKGALKRLGAFKDE